MLGQIVQAADALGRMAGQNQHAQHHAQLAIGEQRNETTGVCSAMEEMDYSVREVAGSIGQTEQTLGNIAAAAHAASLRGAATVNGCSNWLTSWRSRAAAWNRCRH